MPSLPGSNRIIAIFDDGVYHAPSHPWDPSPDRYHFPEVDEIGWFICLCGKHVPGPRVEVAAITCIACLAVSP